MFATIALAAILTAGPVQPGTLTTSPAVCATAGLWAEPAGEAGYVCATSDPSQLAAIAAAEVHQVHRVPVHHVAVKHHATHHAKPKHHGKPRHRAGRK